MSDFILIDGDTAKFLQATFLPADIAVRDGQLTASGKGNLEGKAVCIEGDEATVIVQGCAYSTPSFSTVKGVGLLKIKALNSDQIATKTTNRETAVLLKGGLFDAEFKVIVPAQQLVGVALQPDAQMTYAGKGQFETTNTKWTAT
ncbi:MAG: hypothetical protein F6J87_24325 [Spirulina sp. SIO3F2]|nr:hypothetical protein [Spirulina sp. SIO3F2]